MALAMVGLGGAGLDMGEREAESAIGTIIAQVITLIRQLVHSALDYVGQLIKWVGEHPLAASTFFMNLLIWFS
jgi:hypothetical protein